MQLHWSDFVGSSSSLGLEEEIFLSLEDLLETKKMQWWLNCLTEL